MPAWLLAALALLGIDIATGGALPGGVGGRFGLPYGPAERQRRRRRRRALTASDRADIAFITGLLGPTAGKNFALTVVTRSG